MMSLMPSGMPSIGDKGRPSRQRAVERVGGNARRGDVVADEGADGRLEFLQTVQAAFEKCAGRVAAGGKTSRGGEERHRLRQRHRFSP